MDVESTYPTAICPEPCGKLYTKYGPHNRLCGDCYLEIEGTFNSPPLTPRHDGMN